MLICRSSLNILWLLAFGYAHLSYCLARVKRALLCPSSMRASIPTCLCLSLDARLHRCTHDDEAVSALSAPKQGTVVVILENKTKPGTPPYTSEKPFSLLVPGGWGSSRYCKQYVAIMATRDSGLYQICTVDCVFRGGMKRGWSAVFTLISM